MTDFVKNMEIEGTFEYYFKEISSVPRGSYHNRKISDYLVNFAKEHNLQYIQDEKLNVIIFKDATQGYEKSETVIIQGHMDMVCEKTTNSSHDFENEGLELIWDDKYIYANDTTLGGDDGIAVAYALAILASDEICHPALEVVITTDEEVGMGGAMALDTSVLKGKYMLNLDSEEEGVFLVSCAGGMDVTTQILTSYSEAKGNILTLTIDGLLGGHSGVEIDKNRANANVLLGRVLNELKKKYFRINLISVDGGNKDNAIPRKSVATMVVDERMQGIEDEIYNIFNVIKNELKYSEPDFDIKVKIVEDNENEWKKVLSSDCEKNVIRYLYIAPNGIMSMSAAIDSLVETSLNLGIMETNEERIKFVYSVRSSVESCKKNVYDRLSAVADCCGAICKNEGEYPGWEYEKDSKLRQLALKVYEELEGKSAQAVAIHAGLECGIIKDKIPQIDIISYGPDILNIHTTEEKMDMESATRVYNFTIKLLECMKCDIS